MPPKVRFSKKAVVEAALQLARQYGMEGVNARAIANELGCSTQPLFREFSSMEEIKGEIAVLAMGVYRQYVLRGMASAEKPYKAAGTAYIRFAQQEPQLFKMLFMCDRSKEDPAKALVDDTLDAVLAPLMEATGLSREEATRFHLHSWIFVHGMASMVATHYISFTDEEISGLLSESYQATRLLFLGQQNK